jgi:hypothetical protein
MADFLETSGLIINDQTPMSNGDGFIVGGVSCAEKRGFQ